MMRWLPILLLLAPLTLCAENFRVGAAKRKITPLINKQHRTYIAGYGNNRIATHVIHDLWARSIAIAQGKQTVVLCALDLIGYMIHRVARIKQRVLAHAAQAGWKLRWGDIIITSTHNHHGPDTIGMWGPNPLISGVRPAYLARLEKAAADAIIASIQQAVPAEIRHTSVRVPAAVRDAHAPVVTDPELSLLQARTPGEQGRTIATLLNFASHPELLSSKQTGISSDYVHFTRTGVEAAFGGVAVFFSGALGGMQTPPSKFGRDVKAIAQIGKLLADAAVKALRATTADASRHFFVHTRLIRLPMDNARFRLGFRLGLFGKGLKLQKRGKQLLLPCEISILRIGSAELISNPGELYPEIGNAIKQQMKGKTRFILGLAGNEIGYILPAKLWGDPRYKKHRYEESMSLGKQTGPLVRKWMLELTGKPEAELDRQRQDLRAEVEKLLQAK